MTSSSGITSGKVDSSVTQKNLTDSLNALLQDLSATTQLARDPQNDVTTHLANTVANINDVVAAMNTKTAAKLQPQLKAAVDKLNSALVANGSDQRVKLSDSGAVIQNVPSASQSTSSAAVATSLQSAGLTDSTTGTNLLDQTLPSNLKDNPLFPILEAAVLLTVKAMSAGLISPDGTINSSTSTDGTSTTGGTGTDNASTDGTSTDGTSTDGTSATGGTGTDNASTDGTSTTDGTGTDNASTAGTSTTDGTGTDNASTDGTSATGSTGTDGATAAVIGAPADTTQSASSSGGTTSSSDLTAAQIDDLAAFKKQLRSQNPLDQGSALFQAFLAALREIASQGNQSGSTTPTTTSSSTGGTTQSAALAPASGAADGSTDTSGLDSSGDSSTTTDPLNTSGSSTTPTSTDGSTTGTSTDPTATGTTGSSTGGSVTDTSTPADPSLNLVNTASTAPRTVSYISGGNVPLTADAAAQTPYTGQNINGLLLSVLLQCYKDGQEQLRQEALSLQASNNAKNVVRDQLTTARATQTQDANSTDKTVTTGDAATVSNLEDKLSSMGDDAQMQQLQLQDLAQNQQQLLQMISNFSKETNTNSMAIIRNIAG